MIARQLSTWNDIFFICIKGSLIIYLLATTHCTLAMETSEKEAVTSMFKLEEMSYAPTYDPTVISVQVPSLMSCVFHCHKMDFSSFYYLERNTTCLCRSADDNKTESGEAADQKVIYGIRSKKVTTGSIQVRKSSIYLFIYLFIYFQTCFQSIHYFV